MGTFSLSIYRRLAFFFFFFSILLHIIFFIFLLFFFYFKIVYSFCHTSKGVQDWEHVYTHGGCMLMYGFLLFKSPIFNVWLMKDQKEKIMMTGQSVLAFKFPGSHFSWIRSSL